MSALMSKGRRFSNSQSVESLSRALECVDDVEGGDRLPLGVLGVGDSITDNVCVQRRVHQRPIPRRTLEARELTLEEDLEDTAGLLVDETRDTLDSSTTRKTADSGLGDSLDVVTKLCPEEVRGVFGRRRRGDSQSCGGA